LNEWCCYVRDWLHSGTVSVVYIEAALQCIAGDILPWCGRMTCASNQTTTTATVIRLLRHMSWINVGRRRSLNVSRLLSSVGRRFTCTTRRSPAAIWRCSAYCPIKMQLGSVASLITSRIGRPALASHCVTTNSLPWRRRDIIIVT